MIIISILVYLITIVYASIIDIRKQIIYNGVYFALIILSFITYGVKGLLINLPGAALITIPILIIAIKTDMIGGGDIKFIFCNILYLGFRYGYAGTIAGLGFIILMYLIKWKSRKLTNRSIPMVPYLSCGYILFVIEKLFDKSLYF
jgi:leader peptidase (prepilin peptidase)/N-methyltransferase